MFKAVPIVVFGFVLSALSGCSPDSARSRADSNFDSDSADPAATIGPASRIQNLDTFIQALNLAPLYDEAGAARPVKVAVLDNGFYGYDQVLGDKLPKNTQYHAGPVDQGANQDPHGLIMAELLAGLMTDGGRHPELAPELHLYNTDGFSNLQAAVADCVARKIDVVLYAQVWEYGGNLDGRGFINATIDQATRAGIVWVNASGDFGDTTYTSAIQTGTDDWLPLPDRNQSIELRCEAAGSGTCPLRLVLSWNDFKDDADAGTEKDLDLFLTDDTLNVLASSQLTQTTTAHDDPGFSLYPREILETKLKPGTYFARVKNRSQNFGPKDTLRLTASGDQISMPSHVADDTLLTPSDNPTVISVGASDSGKTGASKKLHKPEIRVPSLLILSGNAQFKGTSSAASAVAATIALLKSVEASRFPTGDRAAIIDLVRARILNVPTANRNPDPGQNPETPPDTGRNPDVAYGPTGPNGCYQPLPVQSLPAYVRTLNSQGGVAVQTTQGPMVLFGFDPILLLPGSQPAPGDIVVTGPVGVALYKPMGTPLPGGVFPLGAFPADASVCF